MSAIKECSEFRNYQGQYLSLNCVQYKINQAVTYFSVCLEFSNKEF